VVFKYEDPDSGDAAMNWEDHALTLWNELPAPWKHTHAEGNVPWDQGEGYRRDASGVLIPVGLAARLIPGLKTKFSADHFFSYVDRWIYEDGSYTGGYAAKITELVAAATADDWTNGAHLPNHLDPKYADYICYAPQGTDYGIMSGWALAMYLYYRATYPGS
jgi:hypothetical protein